MSELVTRNYKKMLSELLATCIFLFSVCAVGVNMDRLWASAGLVPTVTNSLIPAGSNGERMAVILYNLIRSILCSIGVFLAAFAVIKSFGQWSGAHFNPAITVGAAVGGKLAWPVAGLYVLSQVSGALLAMILLQIIYSSSATSDSTSAIKRGVIESLVLAVAADSGNVRAFLAEFVLAFILVFVVYAVALGPESPSSAPESAAAASGSDVEAAINNAGEKEPENQTESASPLLSYELSLAQAPLAIAACIGFLSMLASSVSGGCFNPARAIAPAILTLQGLGSQWIYWLADSAGAAVAAITYLHLFAGHD